MIQRAETSFFDLLTGDLAMAYALDCESKALAALIAGYTDSALVAHAPVDGGVMDPTDPQFGDAFSGKLNPMLGTTWACCFPQGGTFLDPPAKPLPASTEQAAK